MKICIVSNLYPPVSRGGAETIARRTAHELHLRGHDVFVVSTQKAWQYVPRVTESNVERVYRFRPALPYHTLDDHRHAVPTRALWHLCDMFGRHPAVALGRVLDEEKPDVVLTHNLKGFGMRAVEAIRARGIRHVHTLHDVQLAIPSGLLIYGQEHAFLNDSFAQRWYERKMAEIVGSPDVVVSPSRFLSEFYRARGFFPKSRLEIVPNPAPNIEPHARTRRPNGPLRILYAGQLETHKGIRWLLEALNAFDVPFELHVAGDGTLSSSVSAWADRDRRVVFHGFCSLDNLVKLFRISDAVVVPSLCYENSPTVIYEAFRTGVPAVAANIGGVGELVRDGENGYLFAPGDADGLRAALRKLAVDQERFWERSEEIRTGLGDNSLASYVERLETFMR